MDEYTPPASHAYIGIDPGTRESGVVVLEPIESGPSHFEILPNELILPHCERILHAFAVRYPGGLDCRVGVEMIACYGMPVGKDVFETCLWIGRFVSRFPRLASPVEIRKVHRKEVAMTVCGSPRANDSNVRRAVIDQFPASGGGKVPQIGTKLKPGPLYGIKSHLWAALAVALTAKDEWNSLESFSQISEPLKYTLK